MVGFPHLINPAFGKTNGWYRPFTTAARHALPGVLAYIGVTFWAFKATF